MFSQRYISSKPAANLPLLSFQPSTMPPFPFPIDLDPRPQWSASAFDQSYQSTETAVTRRQRHNVTPLLSAQHLPPLPRSTSTTQSSQQTKKKAVTSDPKAANPISCSNNWKDLLRHIDSFLKETAETSTISISDVTPKLFRDLQNKAEREELPGWEGLRCAQ